SGNIYKIGIVCYIELLLTFLSPSARGMQFFQFIFLKRSWAADKDHLGKTMRDLAKSMKPLWLLIFPEGTLISDCTRKTSQKFAEKAGLVDHKHLLLPRSTGLLFCMKELQESVDYIYDMTIGFDGVQSGEYPEDRYTLRRIFFEGRYPPTIHVHVRRYAIADIPNDENKFTEWLRQRWTEKDDLMTEFYSKGRFTSIYDSPKIMKIQMRNIIELAQIWYFMVPCVIVWYLINTYSFGWAIPSV
ncbi:1647_t:CDS:2, partial [Paraglomus occultum]